MLPRKVRLYLTCPHLSGQGPAQGQVVHGEAQAGPWDPQLYLEQEKINKNSLSIFSHLVPGPVAEADVVLVNSHPAAVWVKFTSEQNINY